MSETELERMVVRLMGDGSSYVEMCEVADSATTKAAEAVVASTGKIEMAAVKAASKMKLVAGALREWGQSLSISGQGLTAQLTNPLKGFGKDALGEFMQAEDGLFKLKAAIKANGHDVKATMKDYDNFAQLMQKLTRTDDDAVLSLLQVAESLGVTGEKAKKAVRDAIGMEAMGKGSAAGNIRFTAAFAQSGDAKVLQRQFRSLGAIKDANEKTAEANRLLANSWEVAKASARSTAGVLDQMKIAIGNLKEEFGSVIAGFILPFAEGVKELALRFQQASPEVRRMLVIVGALVAAIGPAMVIFGGLVTLIGTTIASLSTLSPLLIAVAVGIGAVVAAISTSEGGWEGALETAKTYFFAIAGFLENLPENWGKIMKFVQENWDQMLTNAAGAVGVFFANMIENAGIAVSTFMKVWSTWQGFMAGLLGNLFTGELPKYFLQGLRNVFEVGLKMIEAFAGNLKERVLNAMSPTSATKDSTLANIGKNQLDAMFNNAITGFEAGMKNDWQGLGTQIMTEVSNGMSQMKNPFAGIGEALNELLPDIGLNLTSSLEKFFGTDARQAIDETTPAVKQLGQAVREALEPLGDNNAVREGTAEFRKSIRESTKILQGQKEANRPRAGNNAPQDDAELLGEILEDQASKELPLFERMVASLEKMSSKDGVALIATEAV